ncbi:unnamed protein product [Linum trigynum]|uniref:Uncharacterized protein n=1 Tax=Linum trigynum TaxID=586398 RepID=A0AAV2GBS7_9ROSI
MREALRFRVRCRPILVLNTPILRRDKLNSFELPLLLLAHDLKQLRICLANQLVSPSLHRASTLLQIRFARHDWPLGRTALNFEIGATPLEAHRVAQNPKLLSSSGSRFSYAAIPPFWLWRSPPLLQFSFIDSSSRNEMWWTEAAEEAEEGKNPNFKIGEKLGDSDCAKWRILIF